jgi:hypothetical protein
VGVEAGSCRRRFARSSSRGPLIGERRTLATISLLDSTIGREEGSEAVLVEQEVRGEFVGRWDDVARHDRLPHRPRLGPEFTGVLTKDSTLSSRSFDWE